MLPCPKCGRQATEEAATCPDCGHDHNNGALPQQKLVGRKPPPPPEVSSWTLYELSPEEIAHARETFDLEEFMAGLREIRETGGLQFEDFIEELERAVGKHEQ